MVNIKRFNDFILEKSIGSEEIRTKWYPNMDKKLFYKIVKIDPTSIRKKEFSKPGKYVKWLLREWRKGNLTEKKLNDGDFTKKLNYYLFIFSTGWFKNQQTKNKKMGRFYLISDIDILKYNINNFTETISEYVEDYETETENSKFDVVYSDNKVDILVPINFAASFETAKNTEWCSQSLMGYSM